jgi:SAM-dependent methyltransferase
MSEQEKNMLEENSSLYLAPDPGRVVDQKVSKYMVEKMFGRLKGPKILEMGFGDNYWTARIIEKFGQAYIVDASESLLEKAKEIYGGKVTTFVSLFETFEAKEKFDTVLATFVLDHVADHMAVLKQARTWLAEDGVLIIMVPHALSLHRRLAVCMGMQKEETDLGETDLQLVHRRVFTIERLEKDLSSLGYRVVKKGGMLSKALPQGMMTGYSDEMLKGLVELGSVLPMEYAAVLVYECIKS